MTHRLSFVQILHTAAFRRLFWALVNQEPTHLVIVSPFLGGLPNFSTTVEFARYFLRTGTSKFTLITRPPRAVGQKGGEGIIDRHQAEALIALGVNLLVRKSPLLHSKVYQLHLADGSRVSFVGSANFSMGGFQTNDETVVFLKGRDENTQVDLELARLAGYGSFPYREWDILNKRSGA